MSDFKKKSCIQLPRGTSSNLTFELGLGLKIRVSFNLR